MIHESRQDYEKGLQMIVAGEVVPGENVLTAATDRIRVAAEVCSRSPGCDATLFVEAMAQVFEEQRAALEPLTQAVETYGTDEEGTFDPDDPTLLTALPGIERSISLLDADDLRSLIPLNKQVASALNDWLTWNRPALMDAYENYQYLRPKIAPIYEEGGLPEALLFGIMAKETGGKVHAYSRAGAAGPLQFMGHTARRYGLGSINGFDMRLDPEAATRANVAFINDQLKTFNYDLEKTLAAYNSGETRLRRMHRKHPGAEFWETQIYFSLPTETRKYVPQVLAAILLFLHPEEYNLEFPEFENNTTMIVLDEEISIGELTICLGQQGNSKGWFRTLRNLNPRLRPAERMKAGETIEMPSMLVSAYAEQCVGDSPLVEQARRFHDAGYPDKPEVIYYTVRRGDTLAAVASRHRCWSMHKLAAMNGIAGPNYIIHVGQRLAVPRCG
jgi:membrane-bound lytic murein transglycosylase D